MIDPIRQDGFMVTNGDGSFGGRFYTDRAEAEAAAVKALPKGYPDIGGCSVYVIEVTRFTTKNIQEARNER